MQAQRDAGIQLDELDYLRLVKARGDVDAAMLNAQKVVADADKVVRAARQEFIAALGVVAKKYQFDPAVSHRFDDEGFRLFPE